MTVAAQHAAEKIQALRPDFQPKMGFVLGSGLGDFANHIQDSVVIDYTDIPGFPVSSVVGHAGRLHLGYIHGVPVVCLQGRAHYYEGFSDEDICTLIRTLKFIGCEGLILTNAVGSLHQDIQPGQLGLVTDHINFQGRNPLVGSNDDSLGPRFIALDEAYDKDLRQRLADTAKTLAIDLHPGIYAATLGPVFETPAEIRAYRILGADFVGMSTVGEVMVANHCGLPVAAISCVTNLAAGMKPGKINHEETLEYAQLGVGNLSRLLLGVLNRR